MNVILRQLIQGDISKIQSLKVKKSLWIGFN